MSQLVFWSYMSYVMYVYIRPASKVLHERTMKDKIDETDQNELEEFKYFPKILLESKVS